MGESPKRDGNGSNVIQVKAEVLETEILRFRAGGLYHRIGRVSRIFFQTFIGEGFCHFNNFGITNGPSDPLRSRPRMPREAFQDRYLIDQGSCVGNTIVKVLP